MTLKPALALALPFLVVAACSSDEDDRFGIYSPPETMGGGPSSGDGDGDGDGDGPSAGPRGPFDPREVYVVGHVESEDCASVVVHPTKPDEVVGAVPCDADDLVINPVSRFLSYGAGTVGAYEVFEMREDGKVFNPFPPNVAANDFALTTFCVQPRPYFQPETGRPLCRACQFGPPCHYRYSDGERFVMDDPTNEIVAAVGYDDFVLVILETNVYVVRQPNGDISENVTSFARSYDVQHIRAHEDGFRILRGEVNATTSPPTLENHDVIHIDYDGSMSVVTGYPVLPSVVKLRANCKLDAHEAFVCEAGLSNVPDQTQLIRVTPQNDFDIVYSDDDDPLVRLDRGFELVTGP